MRIKIGIFGIQINDLAILVHKSQETGGLVFFCLFSWPTVDGVDSICSNLSGQKNAPYVTHPVM
jgi:hypothetical protein